MSKIHGSLSSSTKLSFGVLGLVSGTLLTAQPATAAFFALQNPVIGGTSVASPPFNAPNGSNTTNNNALLRCSNSDIGAIPVGNVEPCFLKGGSTLSTVLQGIPGNPGGHVELNPITSPTYDFTKFTSLSGTFFNANIPFFMRSLVATDWSANNNALTRKFLTDALEVNGFDDKFLQPTNFNTLVNTFIARGGPQRFSDPNVTYVRAEQVTQSDVRLNLGLAGTLNASDLLTDFFAGVVDPADIPDIVQVSEVAFINFAGRSGYFYALGGSAFPVGTSGQSSNDFGVIPGCDGGAALGPLDAPEAGCSYSADFQLTQTPGLTAQDPIFPNTTSPTGVSTYDNVSVTQGTELWFDPPAVTGYEFVAEEGGPFFASVRFLPRLGTGVNNDEFTILLDQGGSCNNFVSNAGTVLGGNVFTFAPSVRCFAVSGINPNLGIDPNRYTDGNSIPFPVALTFDRNGVVTFTQTPQTPQAVPEPLTLLGASAAVGIGGLFKRRSAKARKA